MGAFKTPTLREIAHTAPYMHDGHFNTLRQMVEFYDQGGMANPQKDPFIQPLTLSNQEKEDLVKFLDSLSGEGWKIEQPTRFPK